MPISPPLWGPQRLFSASPQGDVYLRISLFSAPTHRGNPSVFITFGPGRSLKILLPRPFPCVIPLLTFLSVRLPSWCHHLPITVDSSLSRVFGLSFCSWGILSPFSPIPDLTLLLVACGICSVPLTGLPPFSDCFFISVPLSGRPPCVLYDL